MTRSPHTHVTLAPIPKTKSNEFPAFGFINPVLIDKECVLVAGHARLHAAEQIGLKVIPTIRIYHLSEAQTRAYILADNKLAENAGWGEDLPQVELEFLTNFEIDFNVDLIGFSTTEIDLILDSTTIPSTDDDIVRA